MPGAGFAVTKAASRAKRVASLTHADKRFANRRFRRVAKQDLHNSGEDALLTPRLWTEGDVA